jgi:hypothetical protein
VAPNFPHHIRGAVLWDPGHHPSALRLRGYHPLRPPIPGEFGSGFRVDPRPLTPHSPRVSPGGSVWAPPRSVAPTRGISFDFFSSPYLDASVRGVPDPGSGRDRGRPKPAAGCPIRRSPDLPLPAGTRGLSQLATSFLGAQAEASTGRRTPVRAKAHPILPRSTASHAAVTA